METKSNKYTTLLARHIESIGFQRTYTQESNLEYVKIKMNLFRHICDLEKHICQYKDCGEELIITDVQLSDTVAFTRFMNAKYCPEHRHKKHGK